MVEKKIEKRLIGIVFKSKKKWSDLTKLAFAKTVFFLSYFSFFYPHPVKLFFVYIPPRTRCDLTIFFKQKHSVSRHLKWRLSP